MIKSNNQTNFFSDEQIINLYWVRNEAAIEKTDVKYGKFLFKIAYNILHDEHACEECKNENYYTDKNKKTTPQRLEIKKYCPHCHKHTVHKEKK